MTDERLLASDFLRKLCQLKLDSNWVAAYLPAWLNELAMALGMSKVGAMIYAGRETNAQTVRPHLVPQMSLA